MTTLNNHIITYIYTLSDMYGNVRYIGKTNNVKKRLNDHILESKKEKRSYKNRWVSSLLKKGFKPFIEILDEVPSNEWEYWEIFYISLFKSWGFSLVNRTIGGNGTGHGINNPNYGRKLSEEHKNKCSLKLKGVNNPFYGKTHSNETLMKLWKPILQYDMSGNFIKEWKSIKDAEKTLKLSTISSCCHNKLISVGNFIWKFKENNDYPIKIEVKKTYRKPVYQLRMNGELIKQWKSVSEAETELKIKHISKVCNNYKSHKTSGGFIWKYNIN